MKKVIIISVLLGIIITIVTSLIPYNYHDAQTGVGRFYKTGFPFKTYEFFGDYIILNNFGYIGNFIFWSIASFVIILLIIKIHSHKKASKTKFKR